MGMRPMTALAFAAVICAGCASPSTVSAGAGGIASPSTTTSEAAPSAPSTGPSSGPSMGSSGDNCSGFAISLARGAKGKPTAARAVSAWLAGKPEGFNPDPGAWHRSGHALSDSVRYAAGSAHVTVSHLRAPGSGWIVTAGVSCV
jgi:hypothetical protein